MSSAASALAVREPPQHVIETSSLSLEAFLTHALFIFRLAQLADSGPRMARVLSAVVCVAAAAAQSSLKPLAWTPLAHGTVKPEGWLYRQLRVQGDGLSGHFADFWKPISENTWTTDGGDKVRRDP